MRTMAMKTQTLLLLIVLLVVLGSPMRGEEPKQQKPNNKLRKVAGEPSMTHLNINRLTTPIYDDGQSDRDWSRVGASGLIYPKGSGKSALFATGLQWGARYGKGGPVRVGGTTWYTSALVGGKLLPGMIPEDASLPKNRIYRVRPDIPPGSRTADIKSEIKDGEGSANDIYDQYYKDWEEWPWQDGAPFDDKNGNGIYEPAIDIPGVKGADQTIFFVSHDFAPDYTQLWWKCDPFGLEIHATFWAYNREGALGSMYFRKYVLINKSQTVLSSL